MSESRPGHEWIDHTSEVTLRAYASSLPELIGEVTRAFLELVPEAIRDPERDVEHELEVEASDPAAMLVDWINELVFLAEGECWLPAGPEVEVEEGSRLLVRCGEVPLSSPFVLVKAATLHNVRVQKTRGGIEAEVTLDI